MFILQGAIIFGRYEILFGNTYFLLTDAWLAPLIHEFQEQVFYVKAEITHSISLNQWEIVLLSLTSAVIELITHDLGNFPVILVILTGNLSRTF